MTLVVLFVILVEHGQNHIPDVRSCLQGPRCIRVGRLSAAVRGRFRTLTPLVFQKLSSMDRLAQSDAGIDAVHVLKVQKGPRVGPGLMISASAVVRPDFRRMPSAVRTSIWSVTTSGPWPPIWRLEQGRNPETRHSPPGVFPRLGLAWGVEVLSRRLIVGPEFSLRPMPRQLCFANLFGPSSGFLV